MSIALREPGADFHTNFSHFFEFRRNFFLAIGII